ncbi:MAG: hypothetical protein NW237_15885 [Cyanobacteriota bacterium]|nr:hypothetical protein [Cyanobacteriota bacterium]
MPHFPPSPPSPSDPSGSLTLLPPSQYKTCRIRVPDQEGSLAAIQANGEFYSFFRVVNNWAEAERLGSRLQKAGDRLQITQLPKGLAIWIWESEAIAKKSR